MGILANKMVVRQELLSQRRLGHFFLWRGWPNTATKGDLIRPRCTTENIKTDDTELFIAEPQIYNYDESAGHVALLAGSYSGLALTAAVGTCNLREVASDP